MYQTRTQADLAPVMAGRKGAGIIPAKQAFPLHTLASDNSYGIFADGLLSILFRVPAEAAWSPSTLIEALPLGSGLQVYRHFRPGQETETYAVVSVPVPYEYPFTLFKGLLTLIRPGFVKREVARLEQATRTAEEAIHRAVSGAFVAEDALPQEGFEPLLSLLGLPEGGRPERKPPGSFNMGFLTLAGGKIGLLADCQSLPTLPDTTVPLPALQQEALLVSSIRFPSNADQALLSDIHKSEASFYREVLRAPWENGTTGTQGVKSQAPGRYAIVRAYFLMLVTRANRLRDSAEDYVAALRASGYPAHMSHLASRDQFCHLYPGNVHLLPDGLPLPLPMLDTVLERFLP